MSLEERIIEMTRDDTYFIFAILQLIITGISAAIALVVLYAIVKSNMNRSLEEVRKALFQSEMSDRENQKLRQHIDKILMNAAQGNDDEDDEDMDDDDMDDDEDVYNSIRNN